MWTCIMYYFFIFVHAKSKFILNGGGSVCLHIQVQEKNYLYLPLY